MTISLDCPYLTEGYTWVRGNLHAHSTGSDGQLSPEQTAEAYASRRYDFLCISDHDHLTWPVSSPDGLIMIPGVEVGGGPHILAVNVAVPIAADTSRQTVVDAIVSAGGLAVLNHPNWETHFNHFPQPEMESLRGYTGIEIYNGVVDFLEGSALATDRWDRLLSIGIRAWGFAHDDAHHEFAMGRAWLVAQVQDRTREGVVAALAKGRFYSSTGVEIESVWVEGDHVTVTAPNAQRICFYGRWGRLVHVGEGPRASYRAGGREENYLRAECWGEGGRCAWTQPILVETAANSESEA